MKELWIKSIESGLHIYWEWAADIEYYKIVLGKWFGGATPSLQDEIGQIEVRGCFDYVITTKDFDIKENEVYFVKVEYWSGATPSKVDETEVFGAVWRRETKWDRVAEDCGISYPFQFEGGRVKMSERSEHIVEDVAHLLLTAKGERFYRPHWGAGLRRLIFENEQDALSKATVEIQRALEEDDRVFPVGIRGELSKDKSSVDFEVLVGIKKTGEVKKINVGGG